MENINKDKELYKEFLNGNEKSFEILINKYKNNLMNFIYGYIKNIEVSEDIFQEVVLYFFSHKEAYNSDYSLKTYLYIIARSKCFNYLKAKKIRNNYIENYNFVEQEDRLLEDIFIEKETDSNIKKVLNKLKPDYQKVIYLSLIEDLSYKDIAKIMDKNISQVKNLVHRAKLKLRKLLIDEKVVEIKYSRIIRVVSILVVSIGIVSCIGYTAYTIVSNKQLKPTNNFLGISFSDEYENYVQKYDEINESLGQDSSPFEKTDVKLISSMCSEGFVSIEFEIDLTESDRELLRLDKKAMTDKDFEHFKNSWEGATEEEKDKKIEKLKKELGINTVKILPNARKMKMSETQEVYDNNIGHIIIDGKEYYEYGNSTTNKLNDYQYQVFLMYFIPEEIINDKMEYTISIDNFVITNGVDLSKIKKVEGKSVYFTNGGDNQKYIETDKKFDIKMSREKSLENSKIITNINSAITHKAMSKKVDKITVGPTQTIIKLSTEYKNLSLEALSSAFFIENHVSTISEYDIFDQDGNKIDYWKGEVKRTVTYSDGQKEEWSPGDIGTWKNFYNAKMNLEEYIVFGTNPNINKIIIKTSVQERKKDVEKHWVEEMVELDNMEVEI